MKLHPEFFLPENNEELAVFLDALQRSSFWSQAEAEAYYQNDEEVFAVFEKLATHDLNATIDHPCLPLRQEYWCSFVRIHAKLASNSALWLEVWSNGDVRARLIKHVWTNPTLLLHFVHAALFYSSEGYDKNTSSKWCSWSGDEKTEDDESMMSVLSSRVSRLTTASTGVTTSGFGPATPAGSIVLGGSHMQHNTKSTSASSSPKRFRGGEADQATSSEQSVYGNGKSAPRLRGGKSEENFLANELIKGLGEMLLTVKHLRRFGRKERTYSVVRLLVELAAVVTAEKLVNDAASTFIFRCVKEIVTAEARQEISDYHWRHPWTLSRGSDLMYYNSEADRTSSLLYRDHDCMACFAESFMESVLKHELTLSLDIQKLILDDAFIAYLYGEGEKRKKVRFGQLHCRHSEKMALQLLIHHPAIVVLCPEPLRILKRVWKCPEVRDGTFGLLQVLIDSGRSIRPLVDFRLEALPKHAGVMTLIVQGLMVEDPKVVLQVLQFVRSNAQFIIEDCCGVQQLDFVEGLCYRMRQSCTIVRHQTLHALVCLLEAQSASGTKAIVSRDVVSDSIVHMLNPRFFPPEEIATTLEELLDILNERQACSLRRREILMLLRPVMQHVERLLEWRDERLQNDASWLKERFIAFLNVARDRRTQSTPWFRQSAMATHSAQNADAASITTARTPCSTQRGRAYSSISQRSPYTVSTNRTTSRREQHRRGRHENRDLHQPCVRLLEELPASLTGEQSGSNGSRSGSFPLERSKIETAPQRRMTLLSSTAAAADAVAELRSSMALFTERYKARQNGRRLSMPIGTMDAAFAVRHCVTGGTTTTVSRRKPNFLSVLGTW